MKNPTDLPLVTVVILTSNRREELRCTLNKILHELDYPGTRLELIVCDNASTDRTVEMLGEDFPSVTWIRLPKNLGIQGWNHGLAAGNGEYFLLLDDDGHIEGDTLKKAIGILEKNEDAGILSFDVLDPLTRFSYTRFFPYGIFSFWGCAVLVTKPLVEAIGGYDPNIFLYSHEPEFVIRAVKAGFRHLARPDLTSYHRKDPSNPGEITDFKLYHEHFSCYYTYFKHLHSRLFLKFLALSILVCLKETATLSRRGRRLNLTPAEALFRAWRLGRKTPSPRNNELEEFIFNNDPRCSLRAAGLAARSPDRLRSLYLDFFSARKSYFPDFDARYLGRWIPCEKDAPGSGPASE